MTAHTDDANPRDERMTRARTDLDASAELVDLPPEEKRRLAERLAGPLFQPMLLRRTVALGYLSDSNPALRLAAMLLLEEYWQPDEPFIDRCENLAFNDPDQRVRGLALNVLLFFQKRIRNPDVKRIIHALIRDEARGPALRTALEAAVATLQQDLLAVKGELASSRKSTNEAQRRRAEQLAGPSFAELWSNRDFAVSQLQHPDAKQRAAAVYAITDKWRRAKEFAPSWVALLGAESDPDLRKALLAGVVEGLSGTEDVACCARLAALVQDQSLPEEDRFLAYNGLYEVCGMPSQTWPIAREALEDRPFRFPDDVDWTFVRSFMT